MRAVVQRVSSASVRVEGREVAAIESGLLVLLGVADGDLPEDADRLADKVRALRIFADEGGRMNEPLGDRPVLCVSQFTLLAETGKGRRPSYARAAPAEVAKPIYERFTARLGAQMGVFGAHMQVASVNDGPVTLIVDQGAGGDRRG